MSCEDAFTRSLGITTPQDRELASRVIDAMFEAIQADVRDDTETEVGSPTWLALFGNNITCPWTKKRVGR